MDYETSLKSSSHRTQWEAVLYLRSEGAKGVPYLALLLARCQAIGATKELGRFEQAMLGFGAMSLGEIVGAIGFEITNPLHVQILRWIIKCTSSSDIQVACHSVYGLGNMKTCTPEAIGCLCDLIKSERRGDDYKDVSLRSVALRILKRLDGDLAAQHIALPAFQEYAHAVEYWISTCKSEPLLLDLQRERDWIASFQNPQSK